jgi:hypothetical protein
VGGDPGDHQQVEDLVVAEHAAEERNHLADERDRAANSRWAADGRDHATDDLGVGGSGEPPAVVPEGRRHCALMALILRRLPNTILYLG